MRDIISQTRRLRDTHIGYLKSTRRALFTALFGLIFSGVGSWLVYIEWLNPLTMIPVATVAILSFCMLMMSVPEFFGLPKLIREQTAGLERLERMLPLVEALERLLRRAQSAAIGTMAAAETGLQGVQIGTVVQVPDTTDILSSGVSADLPQQHRILARRINSNGDALIAVVSSFTPDELDDGLTMDELMEQVTAGGQVSPCVYFYANDQRLVINDTVSWTGNPDWHTELVLSELRLAEETSDFFARWGNNVGRGAMIQFLPLQTARPAQ